MSLCLNPPFLILDYTSMANRILLKEVFCYLVYLLFYYSVINIQNKLNLQKNNNRKVIKL